MSINGRYITSGVADSMKFLEFATIISHCLETFYNREDTARINKKQRRFRWRRKEKCVLYESFSFAFEVRCKG